MGDNVSAPFPLLHVDLNHDPISPTLDVSFPNHHHQYPSSWYSSSSCSHELGTAGPELFPPPQPHHLQRVSFDDELLLGQGGTHDHPFDEDETRGKSRVGDGNHNYSRDHDLGHLQEYCSVKWVSSKMRIVKKMSSMEKPSSAVQNLGSDPKASTVPVWVPDVLENDSSSSANSHRSASSRTESPNNNSNNINNNPIIRVCADCNTTKTPLWRSGPTGPKTLCNACGIRQRKARRAMAAAAAAANGEVPPRPNPAPTKEQQKKKEKKKKMKKKKKRLSSSDNDDNNDVSYDPQPKKKLKTLLHPPVGSRDLRFEEFVMKLSEWTSGFREVFPQDEKEAAILLMALSYGLVRANNIS